MKRSELKAIVKEMLLEILTEGLGNPSMSLDTLSESVEKRIAKSSKNRKTPRKRKTHISDLISHGAPSREAEPNPNIQQAVNILTNDKQLAGILADTASTTLQEQLSAESRGSSAAFQAAAANIPGEVIKQHADMMADAEQNWAKLAFMDFDKK